MEVFFLGLTAATTLPLAAQMVADTTITYQYVIVGRIGAFGGGRVSRRIFFIE
jgi:hypothetical protein